jgi:hypothetical protein
LGASQHFGAQQQRCRFKCSLQQRFSQQQAFSQQDGAAQGAAHGAAQGAAQGAAHGAAQQAGAQQPGANKAAWAAVTLIAKAIATNAGSNIRRFMETLLVRKKPGGIFAENSPDRTLGSYLANAYRPDRPVVLSQRTYFRHTTQSPRSTCIACTGCVSFSGGFSPMYILPRPPENRGSEGRS